MHPTRLAVGLFAALVPAALLPAVLGQVWVLVWAAGLAVLSLATGLDAVVAPSRRRLSVEVTVPEGLFVGEVGEVVASFTALRSLFPVRVRWLVDLSEDFDPQPGGVLRVPARGGAEARIPIRPHRRGSLEVTALWVAWTGPLGLVERRRRVEVGREVAVVPDIRPVRTAAIRLLARRDAVFGAKRATFLGQGSEFESLREWVAGLDPRAISWKASARHRTLLCTEYRAERDHCVVVAVDTGRNMREPLAGLPRLDHAIHAGLLLAYVALRTGDRVGLFGFDEGVRAWVEPTGGLDAFPRLRKATAALAYSTAEANYALGLAELSARLTRRSLVVVMTEIPDSITAELMVESLGRLVRRHVVLFVELEDPVLDALASAEPVSTAALERAVVASDFLRERDLVRKRLRRLGVHVVGAPPAEVGTALVNRYLDAHRRELVG